MTSKRYLTVADYGILTKVVICSLSVVKEAKLNLDEKRRKTSSAVGFYVGVENGGKGKETRFTKEGEGRSWEK